MKRKLVLAAAAIGLAGSAFGVMVAGWDFSQYFSSGVTSVDGLTYATSLGANYSDLDPNGAGAESAAKGRLYYDGQFGSSSLDPVTGLNPAEGNLSLNLDPGSKGLPFNAAGSYNVLVFEGQTYANNLSLNPLANGAIVFSATAGIFQDWQLAFSGKTTNGAVSFSVGFSTDGVNYSSIASGVAVGTTDTLYTYSVAGNSASTAYWKLDYSGVVGMTTPVIDNVSISAVPEPATVALTAGLAAALVALRRRRRG